MTNADDQDELIRNERPALRMAKMATPISPQSDRVPRLLKPRTDETIAANGVHSVRIGDISAQSYDGDKVY